MDSQNELDDALRRLEDLGRAFDSGDADASVGLATVLRKVFQPSQGSTPLVTRLGATYARVASTVPKPPYPQGAFLPLVNVSITLNFGENQVVSTSVNPTESASRPDFKPVLGAVREFRSVQAPDWWRSEPVFVIDHSRATRRDVALWAVTLGGADTAGEKLPRLYERLRQGEPVTARMPMRNGAVMDAPFRDAQPAALRQMAFEVLRSSDLLKLAGRGKA